MTALLPAPGSTTADRTPLIGARVSDSVTELAADDITLRVDGNRKPTATYDAATDRLRFSPGGNLSRTVHDVQVVAVDEHGGTKTRSWSFTIS